MNPPDAQRKHDADTFFANTARMYAGNDALTLEPNQAVLVEEIPASGAPPTSVGEITRNVLSNKSATIGAILTALLIITAVGANWIAPRDPGKQTPAARLVPPAFLPGGRPEFLLGTDGIGRDLLSRLIFGLRISISVSLSAVALAIVVGVLFGLFAGYFGGWLDAVLMRVTDIQLGIPFIVLALAVLATLQPSPPVIVVVLSLSAWPIYARVVRATVLAEKGADYVLAARALGARPTRIIFNYISRNVLPPILIVGTIDIATMVIWEALLGFIGIGIQPPTPSWGNIMADGKEYILTAWWVAVEPGIAIFITLFSLNLLGDSLQKYIDPRLR
jgi:peptide/nickel transport system permease protein